jgi:hypothetical protein
MTSISAVNIKVTVFDNDNANTKFVSYTLKNTPFYFTLNLEDPNFNIYNFSQYQIYWDLGDGTKIVGPSASHYYKWPGAYKITASVYDSQGNVYLLSTFKGTNTNTVTALNVLPDILVFDSLTTNEEGIYLLPAGQLSKSLNIKRVNSWQFDKFVPDSQYTINLYASGSKSNFLSPVSYYTNKYSHLKNFFGFVEIEETNQNVFNTKIVDSTTTSSVSVFAEKVRLGTSWDYTLKLYNYNKPNTVFCGTSGETGITKTLHFIDQTPSSLDVNSVVFLYASLDTKRFIDKLNLENNLYPSVNFPAYGVFNTKPDVKVIKSIFNPADLLEITSSGITVEGNSQVIGLLSAQNIFSFNIYPIKWANTKIPFIVTLKNKDYYTTKCYPPITAFKYDGTAPTELNQISLDLVTFVRDERYTTTPAYSTVKVIDAKFYNDTSVPTYRGGSYFAGLLEVPKETKTVQLCATLCILDNPAYNSGFGFGYVCQPGLNNITRVIKQTIYNNCDYDSVSINFRGLIDTYTVSLSSPLPITVSPVHYTRPREKDKVWIADADLDRILVMGVSGDTYNVFNLSAMPTYNSSIQLPVITNLLGNLDSAAPSYLTTDSKGNAWVTLYDAVKTIKIDQSLMMMTASAVPDLQNVEYLDSNLYMSLRSKLSGFVGENSLLPTCVDTDTLDNIWISYSHPVSGFMIKYNSEGILLSAFPVTPMHSIQEILIDKTNNIWAVAANLTDKDNELSQRNDVVYKWDKNFNLVEGFPLYGFKSVGNITIDLTQSLWMNEDVKTITKISPTGAITRKNFSQNLITSNYIQHIGAISCDSGGCIWVLDNFEGKIYFLPLTTLFDTPVSAFDYVEIPNIGKILDDGSQALYSTIGDWNSIRWTNKYVTSINPVKRLIYGSSNLFDIVSGNYTINKINENFDMASQYKSYILQESLFDKNNLWDNFVGKIVGDKDSGPDSIGKKIYERIANFVSNNSDPDACTLNALKSLFEQSGITFYDFATEYPAELGRVMDLLSIKHKKLWGSLNMYLENFKNLNGSIGRNLGDEIDIEHGHFIVGEPVVAYEKFSEQFSLITNTIVPSGSDLIPVVLNDRYPLSGVNYRWGWNLVTGNISQSGIDIRPYYTFYRFKPNKSNVVYDSVIDFTNPLTTLSYSESSYKDWTKFGGSMERILSYSFYKGLGLLK